MDRKPRKATEANTVMARVSTDTMMVVESGVSAVRPAMPAAVGMSSSPMTATMAPIAAGGKITSIQLVPMARTMSPTMQKTTPTTMKPPSAAS